MMMTKGEQMELESTKRLKKEDKKKASEIESGRRSILILLLVTTIISMILYFKNIISEGIDWPKINLFGSETITFEK